MSLHVQFWAGPGAGKSTLACALFAFLKDQYFVDCELATEYAKDMVWEGRTNIFNNQFYIAAKQYHREERLDGKVDVVISDSPLPLSLFYTPEHYPAAYTTTIMELFHRRNTLNILVERVKPFNPKGRNQNLEESREIDKRIENFLINNNIPYTAVGGSLSNIHRLIVAVMDKLDRDYKADDLRPVIDSLRRLEFLSDAYK